MEYGNIKFNKNKNAIVEQQYLDSLENKTTLGLIKGSNINTKNKYKYKNKLTRNIKSQNNESLNNSYKAKEIKNNTMINFNYNEKERDLNKTCLDKEENDNHNRSCIIFNNNEKNYFLNKENKYNEEKIYYNDNNKINEDKYKYQNNCCSIDVQNVIVLKRIFKK